jgi:MSHA biogenesis protein MshJ
MRIGDEAFGRQRSTIEIAPRQARARDVELARNTGRQESQVEMLRAEVTGLEQSVETIVAQGAADPDRDTHAAIQQLRQEVAELDARLAGATSGLIEPEEMARVLEQVLARTSRLTLHGLRTLPPEAVIAPLAGNPAAGEPALRANAAQIFRHGVEIELSGTYLEMLQFLQALEALPWRFFWDRVEFSVEQHPRGRLKLLLYTLGLQEGWVGV